VAERDHRQRKTSFPAKRAWSPSSAPSWRSGKNKVTPGSSGVKVERQTQREKDEAEESRYYEGWTRQQTDPGSGKTNQDVIDARNRDALRIAKKRSSEIVRQQALGQQMEKTGINSLSDKEIDSMRDLFALEAGGMDVGAYEQLVNQLKKIALTASPESGERKKALESLDRLNAHLGGGDPKKTQAITDYQLANLGYDETGMRTFSEIEGDNTAKFAYYGLQSSKTPLGQIKSMLPQIGYKNYNKSNTRGSGVMYGSGYRGIPGGGGGYPIGMPGITYGNMQGENRYASLPMNQFMVDVHSPMYANRGGIIDLLGDY
jgi:hypothetical protein